MDSITRSELQNLHESLQSLKTRRSRPCEYRSRVLTGLESRTDPEDYYYHGRKRRDRNPFRQSTNPCGQGMTSYMVWQYTLSGWGMLHPGGATQPYRVGEATAFTTFVPSDDSYYLPPESGEWTFFWFITDHPYVIHRIRIRQKMNGQIWEVPAESALVCRASELYRGVNSASFNDEYAEESALFQFMLEYERFGHNVLHPSTPRERLLAEIRSNVLVNLRRATTLLIAKQRGMSRTTFAHYFKKTTGLTPGSFITHVRIGEAAKLLVTSDLKLSAIAELTGFADAVHLGKVFRKYYYLTPGRYRHACGQLRGRLTKGEIKYGKDE
jgi:AraC-like DNA-binding protein